MELSARVDRVESVLEQLAAAQMRTEQQLGDLTTSVRQLSAAQTRTEQRLEELTRVVRELAGIQTRVQEQLNTLVLWQQGERGRRADEQYELHTVRRALIQLQGGFGGSTAEAAVRQRLLEALRTFPRADLTAEYDPSLADLLWWKGDRLLVAEVSIVVDEHDVDRAFARAETLRRAGVDAFPAVIGNVWASPEVQAHAAAYRLEWKVGDDLSDGFIAFRRLPG